MNRNLASVGIWLLMALVVTTVGCAKDKDLKRQNREQALMIQSLNNEIARLNAELDAMLNSQSELVKAKEELEKKLKAELASGDMSVSLEGRGLVLTVQNKILFDSGKAQLKQASQASLEKIADVLKDKVEGHLVYVEGHTDNEPIRASGWRSNWELSTARATEVIHYFIDQQQINPRLLAATGYGEFHPVADNDSREGRQKNRRVEIVISPKKAVA